MENDLEILISATDEASETLQGVGESMQELAEEIGASTQQINSVLSTGTEEVEGSMDAWQASMFGTAQIVSEQSQIMEESYAAMAAAATTSGEEIEATNDSVSTSAKGMTGAVGAAFGIASAAFYGLTSGISDAVTNAEAWSKTSSIIAQELQSIGSSTPVSAMQSYAEYIQSVTTFSQQQALSAEAVIAGNKELEPQYQSLTLLAADLATKVSQFGGSAADMPAAMKMIANSLNDPVAGMNQIIRQAGINIPASMVTMIENMAKAGDNAGADAILMSYLNEQIGGLAKAAGSAPGAALLQLANYMTTLSLVIGEDLLPFLDTLAKDLIPIVQSITDWAAAHPKLTDAIILGTAALVGFVAIFLGLSLLLAVLSPFFGLTGAAMLGMAATAIVAAAPFVLLGGIIAAAAAIIILNWNKVKEDSEAIWDLLESDASAQWARFYDIYLNALTLIKTTEHTLMTDVSNDWNYMWTGMGAFFENIWTTIISNLKTAINNVISIINDLIEGIDALHINIPAITIPGTKIGTPAVNIGFDIPTIPALAEGGIVSVPTVALIGEAGPEAIVPLGSSAATSSLGATGGQPINIYIQGGNYLDKQGADQIAQQLARKIQQQIKLRAI